MAIYRNCLWQRIGLDATSRFANLARRQRIAGDLLDGVRNAKGLRSDIFASDSVEPVPSYSGDYLQMPTDNFR